MPIGLLGQKESAKDLSELLPEISAHYQVRFSYVDETIEGKSIELTDYSSLPLVDLLREFEKTARLRFEMIDEDYVIVRSFRSDDKVSVCGRIKSTSGRSLIGVTIGFSNSEGTFSDEEGNFQLDSIPYGSRLTFRSLGFITEQHNVSNLAFDDCFTITMGESINMLQEVVVQDYLAVGISKTKNQIKIVPNQFKTLSGLIEPDVLQSIQQVPGVNSPYETAAGLYVRGGLPDQNLILWNGIKTYNQGHFFGMISTFNPYSAL
ncbi:MAG: carboxypeptidase-like regulatory domain-containing protein [Bacteroidota bacterium]